MSDYIVSALKYRPNNFAEVVGQSHVTKTLETAIKTGKLSQAYLFTGPRGVGKTTCARIFAKKINQAEGESLDQDFSFNIFELDGASNNGVEEMRELRDQVRIPPAKGQYKVYIIDEVHMLSTSAFNAFLKTLEEPPSYVKFILATTEKHKVLPTILSRCQVFDFRRIEVAEIQKQLIDISKKEGIQFEEEALRIIAEKAEGALRDALSILDRQISFTNGNITLSSILENLNILDYDYHFKMVDQLLQSDHESCLLLFDEILKKGFQGDSVLLGLSQHIRQLLVLQHPKTEILFEGGNELQERYLKQADLLNGAYALNLLDIANQFLVQFNSSKNQRLHVELCLIKMCHLNQLQNQGEVKPVAIKKKVEQTPGVLEKKANESEAIGERNTTSIKENSSTDSDTPIDSTAAGLESAVPPKEEGPVTFEESEKDGKKENSNPVSKGIDGGPEMMSLDAIKNQVFNQKVNAEEGVKEDLQNERTWSIDEVINHWKVYSKEKVGDENLALKTLMTQAQLKEVDNNSFSVILPNRVQQNFLEEAKVEIVEYLKNHLRLNTLAMNIIIDKNLIPQEKRAYTALERYEEMKKKNPKIEQLKNQLGLDLEP